MAAQESYYRPCGASDPFQERPTDGLEQWIGDYYYRLEAITRRLRNYPEVANVGRIQNLLREEWKKPAAIYIEDISEESEAARNAKPSG